MAIDVSKMDRETKLALLSPAVHKAIAQKKAEGTYHQEMKNPVFQAKGIVTFRNNDLPRSALTDITDHVVGSVVLPKNKSQLLAAPPAAMANFQDDTPESQQGRHIAEATLESYQKRPHAKTQEQKDYETRLQQGETGAGAGTPPKDETLIRLQQQAAQEKKENDASDAAFSAYHDRYIHDQDAKDLDAMTPEERKTLTSYGNYLKLQRADASSEMGPEPGEEEAVPREYQALVEKYGASRLAELYETASRDAALEQRQQVQQAAQRQSQGAVKGTLASAATVPVSLVGGPVALMSRLKDSQNGTGRYNSLSPYTAGDALNVWSDSVRQNVGQQIAGDGSNVLRQGASMLYQAGMGTVDSVAKAIVLGPTAAAATSAMGSYARTLSDASEKGATASQAVLLASAQAALDYAMDKIPLDQLAGLAKSGSTSALKAALKQAGIEVTTEGASFLGSQLLEMEILRENSEYQRNISNYMAQGANVQDATAQANKDLAAQAGQQMLVAGLSGGISAGVSTAIGNARTRRAEKAANAARQDVNVAETEPAPEQPTAQPEVLPADTVPDSTADQLLQNPQQLTQEPTLTPELIRAAQQERDIQAEADRIRYEDQKSRAKARKDLQKDVEKTQADVDAGKGSPARLRNLQNRLAQMDMEESDYPRTRQEAIRQQADLVDAMSAEQHDAYIRRETGEATNRPNKTATNRLKSAKAELDRLRNMSDADYAAELEGMGLSGNTRAPWLDDAAASLAAMGRRASEDPQTRSAQAIVDQIRAASGAQPKPQQQEPVSGLPEASDFLRSRLVQQTQDYNGRIAAARAGDTQPESTPIATVSRMAEDIGSNATARQQQTQENLRSVQDQVAALTGKQPETAVQETAQQPFDTTGKQSTPSEDTRKSATFTNSGRRSSDEDIRAGYRETLRQDASAGDYQQKHNADVLSVAQERVSTPEKVIAEYDYIMSKSGPLTAEDGVTGRLVAKQLFKDGDTQRLVQMNKRLAQEASNAGQFNQAFAVTGKMRDVSDPLSAADSATARITGMAQKDSVYPGRKSGMSYEAWQDAVSEKITGLAREVDSVKAGDTAAMKGVITKLAKERGTTAFFGISNRLTKSASSILDKLEFDDLKKIADTQIASMPDDYRKRGKVEIVNGIRKQSMLSSLKTFERNLAGNGAVGLLDSASDSFGGRLADIVLSKVTGKRTIGDDISRAGTYIKSAADAGQFAALCVELNVPIETDVDASFNSAVGANASGKFIGKSFTSASGNPIMRGLYAYQKYMSYALEVSDKIFEGGTAGATEASLRRLKSSGLSGEEISRLSDYTANRRTFKDATWTDEQGRTRGSDLSRTTQSFKNIAKGKGGIVEPVVNASMDTAIPFASVPMNVAQTGIDYTAGVFKGLSEIGKIAIDAKRGIDIPVERQRQAASDFGRGLTGAGLISLAAAAAAKGIIQVHDDSDKDKKALDQSQGLSGAQINWTALNRAAEGGDETWKSGDLVTSLDFLEPFNTHMYLGVELANAESPMDYVKAPFASILSSFADSPMNDGLNQITELITDSVTAAQSGDMKEMGNAVAEYAGNVASSFIPQFVRQAAQTADGYYRDTRGKDSASYAVNSVKSALPGASETLPKKIDGFGKEQKRPGGLSNFLDPTNTKRLELNEKAGYLDRLSERTGDKSIYPDRQAPLTVKNAIGEDVDLTGGQRETYQKTYGQKTSQYYGLLQKNKDFSSLPDDLKTEAFGKAKEYASQFAWASVTDFKGTPEGSTNEIINSIISSVTKNKISSALDDVSDAWENGYDTSKSAAALDSAYQEMQKLSSGAQERVMDAAEGTAKTYLEARSEGLASSSALAILKQVQSIPQKNRQKVAYQYQAVANTKGLSEAQLDTAMKLYMPDYDPSAKKPVKTEVKYDYIRQEMGFSAKEYAKATYAMQDMSYDEDGSGSITKDEAVQAIVDLGFDKATATKFYRIYQGSSNSAKAALNKFIEENY